MSYNPNIHHRKSIRLQGYDYSQAGLYFITICAQDRKCLFGKIENDEMILNDAGLIANECWLEIPKHFPNAVLHEHIIMPNHVHGIVELIQNDVANVGAENTRAENFLPLQNEFRKMIPRSIGSIVKGFKIGVTKWFRNSNNADMANAKAGNVNTENIGAENFLPLQQPQQNETVKIWQRNYYEHIIRDEKSYQHISEYIINNPKNWKEDKFYQQ
jgi:REP element-mobilizing transposase RayT